MRTNPINLKGIKHLTCRQLTLFSLSLAGISLLLCFVGVLGLQIFYVTTPVRYGELVPPPGLSYKDVSLMTGDGLRISAWYVPGTWPEGVILVHGIHANRAYLIPQALILAEAGYHLLLIDYGGMGAARGTN